jgi:hypothetical protein
MPITMPATATPEAAQAALEQVREVRTVLDWLRAQERELALLRDEAILVLVAAGMSYEAVARESGVTRGRVGQIIQGQRA